MNKSILIIVAACISFVFAEPKESVLIPDFRRKDVLRARQSFCYAGNGFNDEKLREIKEFRIYPSDDSYYCYTGCFTTETKSIITGEKVFSEQYIKAALYRTFPEKKANSIIAKCKNIKVSKDICDAGKTIHSCFTIQQIVLADFIGYLDSDVI
ncbi:uncharacterized protein LOC106644329 [Copidosoma floridanum]|uniref:Odorant-binding protein 4 n=1 Tax=Copidosoma floridanum TaxID=29053 RepID=V9Z672_COPFL|nr:uncharacterized protein LOC106644329 [Copidosoma floridanum]AHE40946.1 odorant-binding protein 4 precursor [Copidosoma floridanum]